MEIGDFYLLRNPMSQISDFLLTGAFLTQLKLRLQNFKSLGFQTKSLRLRWGFLLKWFTGKGREADKGKKKKKKKNIYIYIYVENVRLALS